MKNISIEIPDGILSVLAADPTDIKTAMEVCAALVAAAGIAGDVSVEPSAAPAPTDVDPTQIKALAEAKVKRRRLSAERRRRRMQQRDEVVCRLVKTGEPIGPDAIREAFSRTQIFIIEALTSVPGCSPARMTFNQFLSLALPYMVQRGLPVPDTLTPRQRLYMPPGKIGRKRKKFVGNGPGVVAGKAKSLNLYHEKNNQTYPRGTLRNDVGVMQLV